MNILKTVATFTACAALVVQPFEIVITRASAGVPIRSFGITDTNRIDCPKGVVLRLDLADGRILGLGENGNAVLAEPPVAGQIYPVVTTGTWDAEQKTLDLHEKTKHMVGPNDSICTDIFPEVS